MSDTDKELEAAIKRATESVEANANLECFNCKDFYTKLHPNGLCGSCNSLKKCRKCGELVRGVDKTGICWSCQRVISEKQKAVDEIIQERFE